METKKEWLFRVLKADIKKLIKEDNEFKKDFITKNKANELIKEAVKRSFQAGWEANDGVGYIVEFRKYRNKEAYIDELLKLFIVK